MSVCSEHCSSSTRIQHFRAMWYWFYKGHTHTTLFWSVVFKHNWVHILRDSLVSELNVLKDVLKHDQ